MDDRWVRGDAYEAYVGRWSRLVAAEFLDWLAAEPGLRWLDVGCGTGALSSTVLDRCDPTAVLGIDASEGFLARAVERIDDPRARFQLGDATDLPADSADVVVSGLVLNFLPDPAAAVAAMRAAAPAGEVAVYVWDYAGRMELMRHFWDAAAVVDPQAAALVEATRFPICQPDRLEALWREAGLVEVASRAIDVPTAFADFDDYWAPFLAGQGPAPAYAMSLADDVRAALREQIRARLPIAADGSISLVARAWAVRGRAG